jgi:hypothetical protein
MLKIKEQKKLEKLPLILRSKVAGEIKKDLAEKLKFVLENKESGRSEFKEGISIRRLVLWKEYFKDDPEIKKQDAMLMKLHEDVLIDQNVEQIAFELPEKLSREMYMRIYKKIWATIRHDLWTRIQAEMKEKGTNHITQERFECFYNETHAQDHYENVRKEIFNKLMG